MRLVRVHQQGESGKAHHDGVDDAAYNAAPTGLAWANIVATDNQGHGHGEHQRQAVVIECGNEPVTNRGVDLAGGVHSGADVIRHIEAGVDGYTNDRNDDGRCYSTDNLGYLIHVEHAHDKHQYQHERGADPSLPAKLLLHIGTRASQHHKANGKEGDDDRDVQQFGDDRVGDIAENGIVLRSVEVAAQLQEHGTGKGHDQCGDNDAGNTPGTKGSEVLHHLLARGKAGAHQQAHEGHGNGDNVFRRHGCLTFVANISRILVRAAPCPPLPSTWATQHRYAFLKEWYVSDPLNTYWHIPMLW